MLFRFDRLVICQARIFHSELRGFKLRCSTLAVRYSSLKEAQMQKEMSNTEQGISNDEVFDFSSNCCPPPVSAYPLNMLSRQPEFLKISNKLLKEFGINHVVSFTEPGS